MGQLPPKSDNPLRVGILGCANINQGSILEPASKHPDCCRLSFFHPIDRQEVTIHAIASRQLQRTVQYAQSNRIPHVFETYNDLLSDSHVDAVYIPLPNSLHFEWAKKAIESGKHVICEKPVTSNTKEAEELYNLLLNSSFPIVFFEAFHYRHHPATLQVKSLINTRLGSLKSIHVVMDLPLLFLPGNKQTDIRFDSKLAGGATMDLGCYCINAIQYFGAPIEEILSATAVLHDTDKQIDLSMKASFRLAGGAEGSFYCGFLSKIIPTIEVTVTGTDGTLKYNNFIRPDLFSSINIQFNDGTKRSETPSGESGKTTYWYQLDAFCTAVKKAKAGEEWEKSDNPNHVVTGIEEGVSTMRIIDKVYVAAGLAPRMIDPL